MESIDPEYVPMQLPALSVQFRMMSPLGLNRNMVRNSVPKPIKTMITIFF